MEILPILIILWLLAFLWLNFYQQRHLESKAINQKIQLKNSNWKISEISCRIPAFGTYTQMIYEVDA